MKQKEKGRIEEQAPPKVGGLESVRQELERRRKRDHRRAEAQRFLAD